jgi:acetyl-CoA acetyltransferase
MAGISPSDVQVAQIYDGYSPIVWHWLEGLGFCGQGEAHSFIQGGRLELGGALPVNTFGGPLGEGRLHGIGHLREGVMQIMGRGEKRQVPDVHHSLVRSGLQSVRGLSF